MSVPIHTIGYGGRSVEALIQLLSKHSIRYLVDVRSKPYSTYSPEFSREPLQEFLEANGIRYLFMGDQLGGRPNDPTCYTDGKVNYALMSEKDFYQQGVARLQKALHLQLGVALLCSESKPHECHRSKLIGETLSGLGIELRHIDETGEIKTQQQVMDRLGANQKSLFDDVQPWQMSRKAYPAVDSSDAERDME